LNKKEQLNKKILRQQEIVNGAKTASRDLNDEEQKEFESLQREIDTLKTEIAEEERKLKTQSETERAIQFERQRVSDITALCREFDQDPKKFIDEGSTMDQVRAAMLDIAKQRMKPLGAGIPDTRVEKDEADKFRAAASDSILMRAGMMPKEPSVGAKDLRGMRLRDLAVECVIRKGVGNAQRLDDEALYREAMTPDSQFSGILTNTVNKSMATAYKAATTTYQAWTRPGSNPDFKPTKVYQISEGGDLVAMTQNGEFKFDEMSDNGGVQKTLATFGRSWGFNRQALINDDLSMLVRVPESYVRAAARGINKLVYSQLGNNVKIYDSKTLFIADHSNLAAAGDIIGTAAVGAARAAMRKQKNLRGKETLNIAPSFLLVPAMLETEAQQFLWSIADPASNNAGTANVFRNALNLVVDAELDTYSESAWYLAASPGDIDTIEVTYLNGNDMPKLESQVGFDFLGIKWRIYIDYGVTVLDYRGLYKNPGK
jgi:Mu-like prophage major head subunit gpT.